MQFVLDANVALKCFLPEELSDAAKDVVLVRAPTAEFSLIAPDILLAEFGHGLRTHVSRKGLPPADAIQIWSQFRSLEITLTPSVALVDEALPIALQNMGAFYDALYVTLAVRQDCRVLTADERMTRAFEKLDRTLFLGDFKAP